MKKLLILTIPFIITMFALGVFLFSGLVMLLWNGILPAVFHIGAITLWQAAGILLLCRLLFGGFRGRRHHWHRSRGNKMEWRRAWAQNREGRRGCQYTTAEQC